jgi:hypothetical protein
MNFHAHCNCGWQGTLEAVSSDTNPGARCPSCGTLLHPADEARVPYAYPPFATWHAPPRPEVPSAAPAAQPDYHGYRNPAATIALIAGLGALWFSGPGLPGVIGLILAIYAWHMASGSRSRAAQYNRRQPWRARIGISAAILAIFVSLAGMISMLRDSCDLAEKGNRSGVFHRCEPWRQRPAPSAEPALKMISPAPEEFSFAEAAPAGEGE